MRLHAPYNVLQVRASHPGWGPIVLNLNRKSNGNMTWCVVIPPSGSLRSIAS